MLWGLSYQKDGLLCYAVHAVPLKGLSTIPSEGYEPQTKMQNVGYQKIKSTILAAQVKYLETGLVSAISPAPEQLTDPVLIFPGPLL